MKILIISLVISALILYIPTGIALSKGFEVENIVVEDSNNGKTIKVAHISDLHYPNNGIDVNIILEKLKENKPDLIFLTGDILDSSATKEDVISLQPFISGLGRAAKAFAVSGNHELDFKEYKSYKIILEESEITLLENIAVQTEVMGIKIGIAGIDDNGEYGSSEMKFEKLEAEIPILLLAHRPEKWPSYLDSTENRKPLITFSGHAHGGQIRILGRGMLSHSTEFFPKYTNGLYKDEGAYMVVSRGLGDSDFPIRAYNKYHLPMVKITL